MKEPFQHPSLPASIVDDTELMIQFSLACTTLRRIATGRLQIHRNSKARNTKE